MLAEGLQASRFPDLVQWRVCLCAYFHLSSKVCCNLNQQSLQPSCAIRSRTPPQSPPPAPHVCRPLAGRPSSRTSSFDYALVSSNTRRRPELKLHCFPCSLAKEKKQNKTCGYAICLYCVYNMQNTNCMFAQNIFYKVDTERFLHPCGAIRQIRFNICRSGRCLQSSIQLLSLW